MNRFTNSSSCLLILLQYLFVFQFWPLEILKSVFPIKFNITIFNMTKTSNYVETLNFHGSAKNCLIPSLSSYNSHLWRKFLWRVWLPAQDMLCRCAYRAGECSPLLYPYLSSLIPSNDNGSAMVCGLISGCFRHSQRSDPWPWPPYHQL